MTFLRCRMYQTLFVFVCLTVGLVQGPTAVAQSLQYAVIETLPFTLPFGHGVRAVRDMDGNGILDIVYSDAFTIFIDERVVAPDGFVNRFTESGPRFRAGPIVSEVDADSLPEILLTNGVFPTTARIFEFSSTLNDYVVRQTITGLGIMDSVKVGDSDGDGRREFLFAQETTRSIVRAYEAVSDNVYMAPALWIMTSASMTPKLLPAS